MEYNNIMNEIDWTNYDEQSPTPDQIKQILIWHQEAEFRNLMYKAYGMTLDSDYVENLEKTAEGIVKQQVFLDIAIQIQDAETIMQALIAGNYTVAATLMLKYDDGAMLVKCMSKVVELVNKSKAKAEI